jgi:hypothetical protein
MSAQIIRQFPGLMDCDWDERPASGSVFSRSLAFVPIAWAANSTFRRPISTEACFRGSCPPIPSGAFMSGICGPSASLFGRREHLLNQCHGAVHQYLATFRSNLITLYHGAVTAAGNGLFRRQIRAAAHKLHDECL